MTFKIATAAAALAISAGAASADHLNLMLDGVSSTGMGKTLTIPSVLIDKPGFVVVHEMVDGAPVVPASIGHAYVDAGTSTDVKVKLDTATMAGSMYMIMLHYDTDGDGKYSFGEGMTDVDTPAMKADGTPYMLPIKTGM